MTTVAAARSSPANPPTWPSPGAGIDRRASHPREPTHVAETRTGDCKQIEPRLPRRHELPELVLQPRRAGPRIDEDGALRAPKQQSLTVADREHVDLRRSLRPHGEGGGSDEQGSRDRPAHRERAAPRGDGTDAAR